MEKLLFTFKHNPIAAAMAYLLWALASWGCDDPPSHPGYGLPLTFSLYIEADDLSAMRTSLHAKPKVPAQIWINDKDYRAKVLYSGATSIKNYRRSYEVYLETPFEGMTVFRLNAMVGDYSTMRANLAYHAYELVGFQMPRYEPVALWVNDEYYGVYHLQQLFTEPDYWKEASVDGKPPEFMYQATKALMGTGKEIYANLEQKFSVKYGSKEFVGLEEFVRRLAGEPNDESRARIEELGDVNQILLYMAMVQYLVHYDGIFNNFYFVSTHRNPRFRMLPWDLDVTFTGNPSPDDGTIFEPNYMMKRFFYDDAPYRILFDKHVRFIHSRLSPDAMLSHLDDYYELIKEAWEADEYRKAQGTPLEAYRSQLAQRIRQTWQNYENCLNPIVPPSSPHGPALSR
jgi:hypothetical protein